MAEMEYVKSTPTQTVVPGWLRVGTANGNGIYQTPSGEIVGRKPFDKARRVYLASAKMDEARAEAEMCGNGDTEMVEETCDQTHEEPKPPASVVRAATAEKRVKRKKAAKAAKVDAQDARENAISADGAPVMPWFPAWDGAHCAGYGKVAVKLKAAFESGDKDAVEAVKANGHGNSYNKALAAYKAACIAALS